MSIPYVGRPGLHQGSHLLVNTMRKRFWMFLLQLSDFQFGFHPGHFHPASTTLRAPKNPCCIANEMNVTAPPLPPPPPESSVSRSRLISKLNTLYKTSLFIYIGPIRRIALIIACVCWPDPKDCPYYCLSLFACLSSTLLAPKSFSRF